jgi:hypothetical protein
MAFNEYRQFDYWSTRSDEFYDEKVNIEEYGLNIYDVYCYRTHMMSDRKRYEKKKESLEKWSLWLTILSALLALLIMVYIKDLLCNIFGVGKEDSVANVFFTVLCTIGIIVVEIPILRNEIVEDWFDNWIENRYKYKTQENDIIEKFLTDSHWEWYKRREQLHKSLEDRFETK